MLMEFKEAARMGSGKLEREQGSEHSRREEDQGRLHDVLARTMERSQS
jgi:hypothetical protein